jgi:hypothetical protein
MLQIVLVCDRCNAEIARGNSALEIRRVSAAIYRRRGGEDLCMKCAGRERTRKMSNVPKKVGGQSGHKKAAADPKLTALIIECPRTKQRFASGIATDTENLRTRWKTVSRAKCPHCGGVHAFSVRDAYIKSTLMATGLGTGLI